MTSLPADADLSVGGAADFPLTEDGAGAAVYIMGQACAGNGACPVVFLDADGTPVGWVISLGPDVRDAEGIDDNGFTRVETATATGVAVVGASTRDKLYGVVGPQPVTRAGDPRPSDNANETAPNGALPGPNQ